MNGVVDINVAIYSCAEDDGHPIRPIFFTISKRVCGGEGGTRLCST